MKKFVILSIIFCGLITADVLPYKPKPIIFAHGLGGSSKDWGAGTYKIGEVKTDSIHPDSVIPGSSYSHFLNDFMLPVVYKWDSLDGSFTIPTEDAYPNKTFLEVINFDYNTGSVNAEAGWAVPFPPYVDQIGQEAEIRQRIKEVLEEYYGPNWQNDTSAKVILICHSMGTLSSRYAITQEPGLAYHIDKIITIGGMHKGATFMKPIEGEMWAYLRLFWLPNISLPVNYWTLPIYALVDLLAGWKTTLAMFLGLPEGAIVFLELQMHKYSDAGWDLAPTDVYSELNSEDNLYYQRRVDFKTIASRHPLPSGWEAIPLAVVAAQAPFIPPWTTAAKTGSALLCIDFFNGSDGAVYDHVQSAENLGLVTEEDTMLVSGIFHGAEPKQWNLFRDAIEPPVFVSIDSAIVFKDGERRAYALPNVSDTIKAPGDSIFLKGRTNCYFLANADAKVSLNGSGYLPMQWPSALGREGQGFFYRIPDQYLFVPEDDTAFSFSREIEKIILVVFSDIDILNWRNIMIHLEVYDANT